MYTFTEAGAKGYTVYVDKTVLPLENLGAVWAKAINHDSRKGSNGAGKTTLVNIIPIVLYETVEPNDVFDLKKGAIVWTKYKKNDSTYAIYQFRSLSKKEKQYWIDTWKSEKIKQLQTDFKPSGYKIFKNGKDVTPHGIPACKQYIKKIMSLSKEEFYGTVLINAENLNTLVKGSPTERRKYFEKSFNVFTVYSHLRAMVDIKLKKTRKKLDRLDDLLTELKTLKKESVEYKNTKDLAVDLELTSKKKSQLTLEVDELQKEKSKLETQNSRYKDYVRVKKMLDELPKVSKESYEKAKNFIDANDESYRKLHKSLEKAQERDELKEELKILQGRAGKDEEKDKYPQMKINTEKQIAKLETTIATSKKFLTNLEKLHDPNCPTCGQGLNKDLVHKNIKSLKLTIDMSTSNLESAENNLALYTKRINLHSKIADLIAQISFISVKKSCKELQEELDSFKKKRKVYQENINNYKERKTHSKTLESYGEIKKPSKEKYETIAENLKELKQKLDIVSSEKGQYEFQLKRAKSLRIKIKDLEAQLVDYKKVKERVIILEALLKAYGDRGLKLDKITSISKQLIARLPKYASHLFQESNITFTNNTTKDNFDIMLHRNKKGVKKSIDIKKLSNGEKRRLVPCLMLAHSDLTPPDKRTNLFIADELDGNTDNVALRAFSSQVLPILKKRFPSIIIISHNEALYGDNFDKKLLIEKRDMKSTIKLIDKEKSEHGIESSRSSNSSNSGKKKKKKQRK